MPLFYHPEHGFVNPPIVRVSATSREREGGREHREEVGAKGVRSIDELIEFGELTRGCKGATSREQETQQVETEVKGQGRVRSERRKRRVNSVQ